MTFFYIIHTFCLDTVFLGSISKSFYSELSYKDVPVYLFMQLLLVLLSFIIILNIIIII